MQFIITALIGLLATAGTMFGVYNYVPLNTLEITEQGQTFGATITTINGSDTLSSSRSVINNNFTNLNNELLTVVGTTSISTLVSIGTITTGVWNGTPVGVLYGGTGTTSPTLNQVMIGNGSSGFKVIGFGSSGQFLMSNGNAAAPQWNDSSVDQTANFTWTGQHNFNATTTDNNVVGGFVPTGTIIAFASSSPPTGWLSANGAAVSRSTYYDLFSVIGTVYGVGDGSTTFNVPNLLGRNILMASTTANMGQSSGESNHTMTTSELVAHTHTGAGTVTSVSSGSGGADGVNSASSNTGSTGSTVPFNVLDPYLTTWYIIRY